METQSFPFKSKIASNASPYKCRKYRSEMAFHCNLETMTLTILSAAPNYGGQRWENGEGWGWRGEKGRWEGMGEVGRVLSGMGGRQQKSSGL